MKADSYIVTVKDDKVHVIDDLELAKHSLKAQVNPATHSKQTVSESLLIGKNILNPKYNPRDLVKLLDLYTYHAACVQAVAIDSSGVNYTLKPVENIEPIDAEKERFIEVLENSTPSINTHLQRMVYDRRSIGYGALEVIRESTSESDIIRLKHIPAQTLRRATDEKRVKYINSSGKEVWFVIYGKNYDKDGNLVDVHADTGEFHPYNSLSESERANEVLWTQEYAPATSYYGRPPIVSCLPSIKGDLSAVRYNNSFFENYGMPKFAISVVGDFADYDVDPSDPDYDITQTLRYKISQQIKEVIKNPHSAICITIPSEDEDGNVDLKITPLSVQTEDGHFRMYRKDTRDEVINAHSIDPSRLGIFDSGNLNGTNAGATGNAYKYGTIAPIKAEIEAIVNQIGHELGVTSWKFSIEDVAPIDYTADLKLAEFLFQRACMTPRDLINNFGSKFGIDLPEDNPYLDEYYLNNQPLEQIWNSTEDNPYLEANSILTNLEDNLWGNINEKDDTKEEKGITGDTNY